MPQTVPNRPTKGRGCPHRGQETEVALELIQLAVECGIHGVGDTALEAFQPVRREVSSAVRETAPFVHRRGEQHGHRVAALRGEIVVELIEGAAGPEGLLELDGEAAGAGVAEALVEDDRPAPERRDQKDHDNGLDDDVGLQKQAPEGEVLGYCAGADLNGANKVGFHGYSRYR